LFFSLSRSWQLFKTDAMETDYAPPINLHRRDGEGKSAEPIQLAIGMGSVDQKRVIKNAAKKETTLVGPHRLRDFGKQTDGLALPYNRGTGTASGSKAVQPVQSESNDVPQARTQAHQACVLLDEVSQQTANRLVETARHPRADHTSPEGIVAAASAAADTKCRFDGHAASPNAPRASSSPVANNSTGRSASAAPRGKRSSVAGNSSRTGRVSAGPPRPPGVRIARSAPPMWWPTFLESGKANSRRDISPTPGPALPAYPIHSVHWYCSVKHQLLRPDDPLDPVLRLARWRAAAELAEAERRDGGPRSSGLSSHPWLSSPATAISSRKALIRLR
ncbi:hypothetical protein OC834_006690, partial [Tilletia horrida]